MKKNGKNIILHNKKIEFNFKIKKKYTAGMILKGWEVKLIKFKKINIKNSYIKIKNKKEIYITNIKFNIKNNINKLKKNRKIKILLKKKEINYLYKKSNIKGYTLLIMSIIIKNKWYKIILALCKGKKKYEKRKEIKEKKWKIKKIKYLKQKLT